MSEVPLEAGWDLAAAERCYLAAVQVLLALQGYLAHKKTPPSLNLPKGPRQPPTVGS